MLKLIGFPLSNYYNMVKMVLLEKDVAFEEVKQMPVREGDYLDQSPMGKVPCIEVDGTYLSESAAIIEYIEDTADSPSLYPQDPMQKAKTRELMRYCELYCDLAVRPTFAEAFFGGSVSDEVKKHAKRNVSKGLGAIQRLAKFDPYIAGSEFTYADIVGYFTLPMASAVGAKLFDSNPLEGLPGAADFLALIAQRDSAVAIKAAQAAR